MGKQKRRLGVAKETLRTLALDHAALGRVAGGGSSLCNRGPSWDDYDTQADTGTGASLSGSRKCLR